MPSISGQHEDPTHILNCPTPLATLRWEKALTILEVWMTEHHTMLELQTATLKYLIEWRQPRPLTDILPGLPLPLDTDYGRQLSSRTILNATVS
jgi:hypothetical protein